VTDPGRFTVGNSALGHLVLLTRAPERILALRLAMSAVIGPSSVVLDAGCGSLGVLAIIAARLGAHRVVAVDTGGLDSARALAAENGVADRIEFLEGNLADLPAATGSFDVILGMIYFNDPRRDLAQQQLMAGLATRFAHPGTVFIPDTVRYAVAGYDSSGPDQTDNTRHYRWDRAVERTEAITGISMGAIRPFPGAEYSGFTGLLSRLRRTGNGRNRPVLDGPDMTLLTSREVFTEISYADPATAAAYPPELALAVTAAGRLDTTIWHQELRFGDLLIRDTATTHPLTRRRDVQPGDIAVLATDGGGWGDVIPVTIRRGGGD
jgi:SAM-dependent methyltransferase